jgi:hypothetical protein
MKKFGVFLLIIGLLLLVVGIGGRYVVENHEKIKEVNAYLTVFGQDELTPEFVQTLLDGELEVLGRTITAEDVVKEFAAEDADLIMAGAWVYSRTPLITKIGLIVAGVGLLLAIFGPRKKKQSYARYA